MTAEQWEFLVEQDENIKQTIDVLWNLTFHKIFIHLKTDYDDFASEARQRIYDNFSNWDSKKSSFKTFCSLIVNTKMRTYATELNRQKRTLDMYAESLSQMIGDDTGLELEDVVTGGEYIGISETEMIVSDILDSLQFRKEKLIVNYVMDGYTQDEIAKKLHMNKTSVAGALENIRQRSEVRQLIHRELCV